MMADATEQPDTSRPQVSCSHVLVVLCTYNEMQTLPRVVDRLRTVAPDVNMLVVDDSSPDGTGVWAREQSENSSQFHLISRSQKLGLGSALRDGMRWCLERDFKFLVNLDADMSHDPLQVPRLVELCGSQSADVAIGSRYVHGGSTEGLSALRKVISRALNQYATKVLSLPISDCSGSYRCYRVSVLRKLNLDDLTCNGYGFLEEILTTLHRRGAKLTEMPITYHARAGGRSKLSFSDALGALRVIHQLALRKGVRPL